MTVLALTGGDIALIVLAVGWVLLVLFLCFVLLNTFRVLESTKMTIDAMREETIPLLREVKTSVEKTNREIDRVDIMLDNANQIVGRAERLTGLVEEAARSPLVKLISFGAGIRKGFSKASGKSGGARRRDRDRHDAVDPPAGAPRRPGNPRARGARKSPRPQQAGRRLDGGGPPREGRARARAARSLQGPRTPPLDSPACRAPRSARHSFASSRSAGTYGSGRRRW